MMIGRNILKFTSRYIDNSKCYYNGFVVARNYSLYNNNNNKRCFSTMNTDNKNNNKYEGTSKKEEEIKFFNNLAKDWWDVNGPMKPLHRMNPVRINYIAEKLQQLGLISNSNSNQSLSTLKMIDIGCGAGLLTESFSRLGADVTGLDAATNNISMAIAHAKQDSTLLKNLDNDRLRYIESTVELHAVDHKESYDVVTTMEVVEHVENVPEFIKHCTSLVKPGGCFFLSTINRTTLSYLTTIVAAEYVIGIVQKGTHHWDQYVTPEEIKSYLSQNQIDIKDTTGLFLNPLTMNWSPINDTSVNYILCGIKPSIDQSK